MYESAAYQSLRVHQASQYPSSFDIACTDNVAAALSTELVCQPGRSWTSTVAHGASSVTGWPGLRLLSPNACGIACLAVWSTDLLLKGAVSHVFPHGAGD